MKEKGKWKMKRKRREKQTKRKGSLVDKKGERRKEEKMDRGREKERGRKENEIFPAFQLSNLDSLRVKDNLRNEGYAWVPKSGSFVKLQEVRNFPTWIISSLKSI